MGDGYEVTCDCGRTLAVKASMAGSTKECPCGQVVPIPSLGDLRVSRGTNLSADNESDFVAPSAPTPRSAEIMSAIVAAAAAIIAIAQPSIAPPLVLLTVLVAISCNYWLALLVAGECDASITLLMFVLPGVPLVFAMKRWDLARWPVSVGVASAVVFFVAIRQVSPG